MKRVLILLPLLFHFACQSPVKNARGDDTESINAKAERLSKEILLIDTHIDVPYRLVEEWEDISTHTEKGHFDFERAKKGGLDVPFMSIYVGASYQETGGAKEKADELIDMVYGFAQKWPDKYAMAFSVKDVKDISKKGLISLPMGMENGAPIEDDINNLKYFYERGIRYITLCHSRWNRICDSSYDPDKHWNGLSPFGKEVIQEMNRLGILVDISHVSDSTFYQVLNITKAPLVATHSSCRHFTPGFERNMSDDMIKKLAENGGVIQINFGSFFINGDHHQKMSKAWDKIDRSDMSAEERTAYIKKYMIDNEVPVVQMDEVADHIDHVVKLVGIDYVGIGSDYDGVSNLPEGLTDVSMYPNLIKLLLERGYSEEDIQKIWSGNFLRIWKETEELALKFQDEV
jgi:membrane dipeptidase